MFCFRDEASAAKRTGNNALADPNLLALDLYAAVLDGRPLDGPIAAIAASMGSGMALVQRVDLLDGVEAEGKLASLNIDPQVLADYQAGWIAHDPWLAKAHELSPGVHNLSRLVPAEELVRTAYWNDFLRRRAPTFHGLSLLVQQSDDITGVFAVWRERSAEAFGAGDETLLTQLAPHIRRAFLAESRLAAASGGVAALDAVRQGVAVVGADGRLVHANAALEAMAEAADGLALGRHRLTVARPMQAALDRALGLALAAAAGEGAVAGAGWRLSIPRPSGETPWQVEVLPLRAGGQGAFAGWSGAVVLVTDAQARRPPSELTLMQTFGLTPAEAALASSLARGQTLAEHAQRRRIGMPTARTHLARVFDKTGCRRQADLVARLAALG